LRSGLLTMTGPLTWAPLDAILGSGMVGYRGSRSGCMPDRGIVAVPWKAREGRLPMMQKSKCAGLLTMALSGF
jgi:hypothetical protein